MSQIFTTPSESIEKAKPSFACRLTALIGMEAGSDDSGLHILELVNEGSICQNLIVLSLDAEMRREEEEKVTQVISFVSNKGLKEIGVWTSNILKVNGIISNYSNEPSIGRKITISDVLGHIEL